jgi:GAF domain-containing protein
MRSASDLQALCGRLDRRELSRIEFIEQCTRAMVEVVNCSRAGVWIFDGTGEARVLRCLGIYDRNADRMSAVPDEQQMHVGAYFEALEHTGHVVAVDALTHPATSGLFNKQDNVNDVRSLLAAAFSINGHLFGAFTCTQAHRTMNWTPTQLTTLKRIGARASLALAGATQTNPITLPMPL